MFDIVEKFFTVSGEAPIAGKPVYLIRFAGCNLNCVYCDTKNRNEVHFSLKLDELAKEIQDKIAEYRGAFVLLTGGEPLWKERQLELLRLVSRLEDVVFYVETNGSILIKDTSKGNLRYVVDWKTASSGEKESFVLANLRRLRTGLDCIKIVVAEEDLLELPAVVEKIRDVNPDLDIYLSPQTGKIDLKGLWTFLLENRLDVSLSFQLHKVVWGRNAEGV